MGDAAGALTMYQSLKKKGCKGMFSSFANFMCGQASSILGVTITAQVAAMLALCAYGKEKGVDTSYEISLLSSAVAVGSFGTLLSFGGTALMVINFLLKKCGGGDLSKIQWALPRLKVVLAAYMLGVCLRVVALPTYLFVVYDDEYTIMPVIRIIFACALGQFAITLKLFVPGVTRMIYKLLKKEPPADTTDATGTVVGEGDIELADKNGDTGKTPMTKEENDKQDKRVIMIHTAVMIVSLLCILGPYMAAAGGYEKYLEEECFKAQEEGDMCIPLVDNDGNFYLYFSTGDDDGYPECYTNTPRTCSPSPGQVARLTVQMTAGYASQASGGS